MPSKLKHFLFRCAAALALIRFYCISGLVSAATTFSPAADGHGGILSHDYFPNAVNYRQEAYLDGVLKSTALIPFFANPLIAGLSTGHVYQFAFTPLDGSGAAIAPASMVQYICAPMITIARTGNTTTLSWSAGFDNFHAQGSDSVFGSWVDLPGLQSLSAGHFLQYETTAAPARFYRLRN